VLEFRWTWAGHVSKKVLRAETMDELMAKVEASLRNDCSVKAPTATLMRYFRKLAEEHNASLAGQR
jgi:hypothetical protein